MQFRVLGRVEANHDGAPVPLGRRRGRCLLGVLLLNTGVAIPANRLTALLWDDAPPPTARAALNTHMSRLRSRLDPHNDGSLGVRLVNQHGGYLANVDPQTIDASRFRTLFEQACTLTEPAERSVRLRAALALWRGPILADDASPRLRERVGAELAELRMLATELVIDAELDCGHHQEVVGELFTLTAEHPYRERLAGQLMLALYRSHRFAEALNAYQRLCTQLDDELGVDPSPQLGELYTAVLRRDPALDLHAGRVVGRPPAVPAELPADVPVFVGRRHEVGRLRAALASTAGSPPILAIYGTGGVGKSALAVHVAHAVARDFPDGQLFVDLRGAVAGGPPLLPVEVLGRFLRSLGLANPPTDVAEAAARFRSLTAARRLLLLLDNATDAAQVRPLLPAGGGSAVLVTSRAVLSTLDGATHVHLGTLSEDEALAMLGQYTGEQRVRAEPLEASRIVRFSGHLPLAIRISGARLVAHPENSLSSYAAQLSDTYRRLDQLRHADLEMRASIAISQRDLESRPHGAAALAVLRLIALFDTADATVELVAALSDRAVDVARAALDHLTEAQFLEVSPTGRYRMHDLIRLYAREQALTLVPEQDRHAAIGRGLAQYAAAGQAATKLLDRGQSRWLAGTLSAGTAPVTFRSADEAVAWIDVERGNLVTAVRQAATLPDPVATGVPDLVFAVRAPLDLRSHLREQITLGEFAVEVAGRVGDTAAEARGRMFLGHAYGRTGQRTAEVHNVERSLDLYRKLGDRLGESGALNACGISYCAQHRYDDAVAYLESSLAIRRELGDRSGESLLLDNLGEIHRKAGHIQQAITYHESALALAREIGDRRNEIHALGNLACATHLDGQPGQAMAYCEESMRLNRTIGDRYAKAGALWRLAQILDSVNRHKDARRRQEEALKLLHRLDCLTAEQIDAARHDPWSDVHDLIPQTV